MAAGRYAMILPSFQRWLTALMLSGLTLIAPERPRAAETLQTSAQHAILIDGDTGTILFEKNARTQFEPWNLAKLMTLEVLFDQIKKGKYTLDQQFTVSVNAWRRGGAPSRGSKMFAAVKSQIALSDLITGLIVDSGNDAALVIAEGMAASEEAFVPLMNQRAREVGMTASTFTNATGAPDPGQKVTALGLAILALHIIKDEPEFYHFFGEKEFTWSKIRQVSRNPLLTMDIGADGLITCNVEEPGFGLIGSAVQNGRRVIVVVSGVANDKDRASESRKLIDFGFRAFDKEELFPTGAIIARADVYGGEKSSVGLRADGPVRVVVQRGTRDRLSAKLVYDGPLKPPVSEGTRIGVLRILEGDTPVLEVPLFAAESVGQGNLTRQAEDALFEAGSGALRRLLKR
jgi:D-alanyl-D-alanine carboxypeptidase (penicillin-binding protein 5/6)